MSHPIIRFLDRSKETTTTTGSGLIALGGAVAGFVPISGIGSGNCTYYTLEEGSSFEVGIGKYDSAANTLSRDEVFSSSNSDDSKINLGGGASVFITYPSDKAIAKTSGNFVGIGIDPEYQLQVSGTGSFNTVRWADGTTQITSAVAAIATLTTNLESTGQTNASKITANTSSIATNRLDINQNILDILATGQTNANGITTLTTNLASTGQTNANGITTLTTNLASTGQTNANAITANASSISTLTTNLAATGQTNANGITTLTTNLASTGQTNASAITSNTSSISTLTTNLAATGQTNANGITTLTSNLASTGQTNANAITALQTGKDDYQYWTASDNSTSGNIASTGVVKFVGGGATTVSYASGASTFTITTPSSETSYDYWVATDGSTSSNIANTYTVRITGAGNTTVSLASGSPNIYTISGSSNGGTSYLAGSGLQLNGTTFDALTATTSTSGITQLQDSATDATTDRAITPNAVFDIKTTLDSNIASTGQTNANGITTLTTNLAATGQTNANAITSNTSSISTLTTNLAATGQTNANGITTLTSNLASTGQTNANSITTLTTNLASTGQTNANVTTANAASISTLTTNLAATGQTNANVTTTNAAGISTLTTNLAATGQTNANGITTLTTNLASTGQTNANVTTANAASISTLTTNLAATGQTNANGITTLTTNLASTGQTNANVTTANAASISTLTTNLASTGQTNANAITSLQPGGSNTQIQFNDSSSYGGDSDLTWNKTTNILTVNGTGVFDRIGVNDSTPDAMLDITCSSASTKGLIVEGAASQSENLIEGLVSNGTVAFKVDAGGDITCQSVTATGVNLTIGRSSVSPTIRVADGGNNLNIRNLNADKDINVDIAESGNFFQIRTKDGGTTTTRVQWEDTGKRRDKAASYADIKNNADATTVTFDLDVANVHQVTLGADRTFAVSSPSSGQRFMIRVLQDGTGGHSGTWFNTIKWAGGAPPVQPAAGHANEASLYGFLCVGTNTYDGFVIGTGII